MKVIIKTRKYILYEGNSYTRGMFLLEDRSTGKITLWFDRDEASNLKKAKRISSESFNKKAAEYEYYE